MVGAFVCCNGVLDAEVNDLAVADAGQRGAYRREKRREIPRSITACMEHDDRNTRSRHVLLENQIPIHRQEHAESGRSHRAK